MSTFVYEARPSIPMVFSINWQSFFSNDTRYKSENVIKNRGEL